jgi:hypothetical protein
MGRTTGRDGELAGIKIQSDPGSNDPIWGTGISPEGLEVRGGDEQYVELIGDRLRAAGVTDLGRFRRLTDYVNMLQGFFTLRDVTILTRAGEPTRVTMPELRIRLDDVALVVQRRADQAPAPDPSLVLEKVEQRLVLMTPAHLVAGNVHVHAGGSLLHFVDSSDPKFIPMSDVRVRSLDDRTLLGHFDFALIHRAQIVGVATEGLGRAEQADARRPDDRADVADADLVADEVVL